MATIMRVGGGAGGGKEPTKTIASLSVGDIVQVRENAVFAKYRIIHKGKPSAMYDESCNGVWVQRVDANTTKNFNDTRASNYATSTINTYLNNDFASLFSTKARKEIKSVKIPYVDGSINTAQVKSGADGLSTKVFLLSGMEVGFGGKAYVPEDGAKLDYFNANTGADPIRVANLSGGGAIRWWLRSPSGASGGAWVVDINGSPTDYFADNAMAIRPAMVFDNSALVTLEPNADGSFILLCDAVLDEVGELPTGDTMLITENGIPTEYYIAKHGYEAELNGANRTLLVRRYLYGTRQWHSSNINAYATSDIDGWLNGDFFNSLSSGVRDLVGATAFKYTVGNGNKTLATLERAVFLLSLTEMGLSGGGNSNVEGTALPIASTLRVGYTESGAANTQWLRTAPTTSTTSAYATINSGGLGAYAVSSAYYSRPVFTIPSDAKVVGPDTQGRYSLEAEAVSEVYGIARDITASSPVWTRTDASMSFTATASIGTVAGASDFDNIYPWSEMKRVTLDSGDVMVRIPKFYYGRYRNGNIERIQISGRADVGLTLHPAFNHAGVEQDCIYVGAYKAGIDQTVSSNWKTTSKSGVAPMTGGTRQQFRLWSKAKGDGWSLIDISTLSAIQMLYLVEFANNNSQAMIGRGYVDGNSAKINTGSCDIVPNLTGRPAGTDGKTDIVYRGIEGLWGNVSEWVDGMSMGSGHYYISNDPSKYNDDGSAYPYLSYSAGSWSGSYFAQIGLDTNYPYIMLPQSGATGSESTYWCDSAWTNISSSAGWMIYATGGNWVLGSSCGIFGVIINGNYTAANAQIGSRLIYIPQ